jgi:hypothetical protein
VAGEIAAEDSESPGCDDAGGIAVKHALRILALPIALVAGCLLAGTAAAAPPIIGPLDYTTVRSSAPWWSVPNASGAIELYGSRLSVTPGQRVDLFVNSVGGVRYELRLWRLDGSLGGATRLACGARCLGRAGVQQPAATIAPITNEIRAPWAATERLVVGRDWPSGYFLVQAVLTEGPQAGSGAFTPLIVKRAARAAPAKILLEIPMSTAAAYNEWGGLSAYTVAAWSDVVSLDRPFNNGLLGGEYGLLGFLMRNGFDFDVQSDLDTAVDPTSLLDYRLVLVGGHDEYWTQSTSDAFYEAKKRGVNLGFFGANIGYWRTRLENDGRSIAIYKRAARDPLGVTGYYRDTHPECQLLGVQHQAGLLDWQPGAYTVDPAGARHKWMRGTGLRAGDVLPGLASVEVDTMPNWQELIGETCPSRPVTILFRRDMGGETLGDARAVTYVARSGARIFSAGSLNFVAGIDRLGPRIAGTKPVADPRLEKFVLNMLRGMSGQR